jgi:hypothetical protein
VKGIIDYGFWILDFGFWILDFWLEIIFQNSLANYFSIII